DHLDGLHLRHALLRRDLLERVEVDADEIERLDAVFCEGRDVVGVVAAREDAGVDARMERLHAAAEHLGEVRQRLHPVDAQSELLEIGRSTTARDERPAELGEALREDVEAGLVVCRDQRAHSSPTTRGSSLCSRSLIRAWSVSAVSSARTGTRSWARIWPLSMP